MKRFCKRYFLYRCLTTFFASIFVGFSIFSNCTDEQGEFVLDYDILILALISSLVFMLVGIIYQYIYWRKSGYELTQDGVSVTKGVFVRKKSFVRYDKIHSINKKQGLIQKIFGFNGLYADSGSTNTGLTSEIIIFELSDVVDDLIKTINDSKYGVKENEVETVIDKGSCVYSYTAKSKALYALFALIVAFLVFMVMYMGLLACFLFMNTIKSTLVAALVILFILLVVVYLSTFLGTLIGYYRFNVYLNKDELVVEYGLFIQLSNKLPLNKIKAVRVRRGLVKRLFGYASVTIDVVGYGGSEQKGSGLGILVPLEKLSFVEELISKCLPDFTGLEIENKSKKLLPFLSIPSIVFGLLLVQTVGVCLGLMALPRVDYVILAGILVVGVLVIFYLVIIWSQVLSYRNNGISFNDDKMTISSGGFSITETTIDRKNVIGVENITTHFRKKKNIYCYKIHIFSNAMYNTIVVKNLDYSFNSKLLEFLKYYF